MKGKKWATRAIALLLAIVSLVAFGSLRSSATNGNIYYSDLFYGYSSSYLRSSYLRTYASENSAFLSSVVDDYIDNGDPIWMGLKTALSAATNLKEYVELISDGYQNGDYNYTNALDKANEIIVKKLLSDSSYSSEVSFYGVSKKIAKRAKSLVSCYEKIRKDIDWTTVADWAFVDSYAVELSDLDVFYDAPYVIPVFKDVLPNLDKLNSSLDTASEILEAAGALSLGLMIEDMRLEIIDEIINNCVEGSIIHDGMTRLRYQLRNGMNSYILENYASDMILGTLVDALTKSATSGSTTYAMVTAILKVASWITFDVIFHVPSMQDCLVQQTLASYANGLYSALISKTSCFSQQFISDDVLGFEGIFAAYTAAVNAGLDASENLTIDSNEDELTYLKSHYKSFNYDSYIEDIITTISNSSPNDIHYRTQHDWIVSSPTQFLPSSNTIEKDAIYEFHDAIQGNVIISNSYSLNDCRIRVNGSLTAGSVSVTGNNAIEATNVSINTCTFNEGRLEVTGYLGIGYLKMMHSSDYLLSNGNFYINGGNSGQYHLTAGTVELKGNFNASSDEYRRYYETETHKTILSGNDTQNVAIAGSWNQFENLVFENSKIKFTTALAKLKLLDDTELTVEQDLTINGTLDLNGHSLKVPGKLSADSITVQGENNAIEATSVRISNQCKFNEGRLEVTGYLDIGYLNMNHNSDYLLSNGNLCINGWDSGTNHLTAGTVELKGSLYAPSDERHHYYESGTHKTILSGNDTQNITIEGSWNQFENLVFENSKIKFTTALPKLKLLDDTELTVEQDLTINGTLDLNGHSLKVPGKLSASSVPVTGNNAIEATNVSINTCTFNEGRLEVTGYLGIGYLKMMHSSDYLLSNGDFYINGGNSGQYHLTAGTVELKGNFYASSDEYRRYYETETHKTILSGNDTQNVAIAGSWNQFSILLLQNESEDGVRFSTPIRVTTLFNHNQNNFTLYNNGSSSVFVDYDGDGLKDNVDPYPTLKPGSAEDFVIAEIEPQRFVGTPVMATLTVTCQNETLAEGKHYAVEYMNNNKPGTATAIITGIDNFTGSVSKDFTIYCDHVYTPAETKKATCTQTGVRTFTCFCGDSYTETIPVIAHTPGQWITVQAATTQEEGRMEQRCTVCNTLLNSKKIDCLPQKAVEIAGIDGTTERTVDYKTTITFHSDLDTSVEGGEVHWYVNGKDRGQGNDFTVDEATSTYTVQSKVIKDGVVIAESSIETIKVKSNFLQRIIAFIKRIFNRKAFFIDQR